MAVERGSTPRRLGAGWVALLAITIVAGLVMPPLGIGLAAIGAVRAHADSRTGLRTAFVVLAALFVLMTVFVGVFLVGTETGGGVTPTP